MAAYRFSAKIVSRSRGQSVVAAAAYRAGVALGDERIGVIHDYSHRGGVDFRQVIVPIGSPEWMQNRERLWNYVESFERRRDAQLAREVQLSVPHELPRAGRNRLVRSYLVDTFVAARMVVDYAIHRPDRGGDQRNYHVHALITLRTVDGESFGPKRREWNAVAQLVAWRAAWAAACNRALELVQSAARVTHLSYAARGVDREPEPKLGPFATERERRGVRTHAGDDWRNVVARNAAREREQGRAPGVDGLRRDDGERTGRARRAAAGSSTAGIPGLELSDWDRWGVERERVYSDVYWQEMVDSGLAAEWKIKRESGVLILQRGLNERVVDRGGRIDGMGGSDAEIKAMLVIAESKGWNELTFSGNDDFKLRAMTAALERGFEVAANTREDRALLDQARAVVAVRVDASIRREEDLRRSEAARRADWSRFEQARGGREREPGRSRVEYTVDPSGVTRVRVVWETESPRRATPSADRNRQSRGARDEHGDARDASRGTGATPNVGEGIPAGVSGFPGVGEERGAREGGQAGSAGPGAADAFVSARSGAASREPATPQEIVDRVVRDLTRSQATFTQGDLRRSFTKVTQDPESVHELIELVQRSPGVVAVDQQRGQTRYSTAEVQVAERALFDDVVALSQAREYGTDRAYVDKLAADRGLKDGQLAALHHITGPENAAAVVGLAGTGKTYMFAAARESWERAGYDVHGVALAGKAAEGLEEDSGIRSTTIAAALNRWEAEPGQSAREPLGPKSVIVIEEAGMVGSSDMERLARVAQHAGAKLVFAGDYEQLQAIERGAAFKGITERIGYAQISTVRRQRESWMREATEELGTARTREALARYDAAGYVHRAATLGDSRAELIEKWFADRQAYPEASQLVLAYRNVDVVELNDLARAGRRAAGELSGEDVEITATSREETAQKKFAGNDRVYFLKNDEIDGVNVKNGTLGTIAEIERREGQAPIFTVDLDNGKRVRFDAERYSALAHGYAATLNKAQGVTVDRAYVLATPHFDRHLTYVGMSRHRDESHLFWSEDKFRNRAQLDRVLGRAGLKENALDFERGVAPAQSPSYLRTIVQVRRELDGVLRTSAELARSAPSVARDGASQAHQALRLWHREQVAKLAELEGAGVKTISIEAHDPASLTERVDRTVTGVDMATMDLRDRQRESAARDQTVESSSLYDVQPRTVVIRRIDADRTVARAEQLLDGRGYANKTAGLLLATGRRPSEVLKTGTFELDPENAKAVRFFDRGQFVGSIPVLVDPKKIVNAHSQVREQRDFSRLTTEQIYERVRSNLSASVQAGYGQTVAPKDLRSMYAAIAYDRAKTEVSQRRFFAEKLGHQATDDKALLTHTRYFVGDQTRAVESAKRGFEELSDELGSRRIQESDPQVRENLDQRIAQVAQTQVAVGPALPVVLDIDSTRAVIREGLERAHLRLRSLFEVGAVKIPEVPRSPEARVAEELAQLRTRALQARELSAEELGQVRAAEANFARTREQKYAQEAQRVRQQRDSRAAEAARLYQQREADVARVDVQQSMRKEYLAELDPYHRALESETLRQAELGYARGEIARLESLESRLVALEAQGVDRVSFVPSDERNARLDAELREFQRAVDAPDERNARLDAELREFQRAVDAPDERNARLDAELREFQRAVDAPDERNARLDADLESLRRSIEGLEVERDGLEFGHTVVGEERMPEPEPEPALERTDGLDVSDNSIELAAG